MLESQIDRVLIDMAQSVADRFGLDLALVREELESHWQDKIATLWQVEDVQSLDESLTDEQAVAILKDVADNFDAEQGINWDAISASIDKFNRDGRSWG